MIEGIREERHEDVRARKSADVLDKLPDEHDDHIGGSHPTDGGTERDQQAPNDGDVLFSEFFGERPSRKDADPHGNAADDIDEHLRNAV